MTSLYLPGVGNVDPDVYRAHLVAHEYDDRLTFRVNEQTGDYCVFVKTPRPHSEDNPPEVPVLGFGKTIPSRDELLRKLDDADTLKHGDRLLRRIRKNNEAVLAQNKYKADQRIGEAAELMERPLRLEAMAPFRSFRPRVRG